jgi:hypothetical protein
MAQTLFYFNGSACPIVSTMSCDYYKSAAEESLLKELRRGTTLKELGDEAMETMEIWEKLLCEAMAGKSYSKKGVKKWINKINNHPSSLMTYDEDLVTFIWGVNIMMLIKLKRIPNDEYYGTLITLSRP